MKKIVTTLLLILFIGFNSIAQSTNWNQFRGLNRSGTSLEMNLPDSFPANGLRMLWKKQIGSSFAEIAYVDGIAYTMFSEQSDSLSGIEYLGAFDGATGNELWRAEVDSIYIDADGWGNGARATPTIDGNMIYTFSGSGTLTASAKEDGKQLWQVDFVKDLGATIPRWGYACSPLIVDDLVVMEAGGSEERAFVAFNKTNGELVWAKGNANATHTSPIVTEVNGEKQVIFSNGRTVYAYNLQGDTLWTYSTLNASGTVSPVVVGKNKLFLSTISRGFEIIDISGNQPKKVLNGFTMKNDFSTSVYHDGYIYGFHIAALQCISAETGEKMWTKRGFGKGNLMVANGKLFVISDKGKLVMVEATPQEYIELGIFQALEGKSWTAPSIADGKIFVRNLTHMACFELNPDIITSK